MRTLTGAQEAAFGREVTDFTDHWTVEVEDADGTYRDLSEYLGRDWREGFSGSLSVDQPVPSFTIKFARDHFPGYSAHPLREDSPFNRDASGAYAPTIDGGRGVKIKVATTEAGRHPSADEFETFYWGQIRKLETGSQTLNAITSGRRMHVLSTRWIKETTPYGSEAGVPVEDVLQQLLNDWGDGLTLYSENGTAAQPFDPADSPGFLITQTFNEDGEPQEGVNKGPVLQGVDQYSQLLGWVVRERWLESVGSHELVFYEPDRGKTVPDWTLGPDDYTLIPRLDADFDQARNDFSGLYTDAATGDVLERTTTDPDSLLKLGSQWMQFIETNTAIDTATEMDNMLAAAKADLSSVDWDHTVRLPGLWWFLEIADLIRFLPNGVHYSTAQDFAIYSIQYEVGVNGVETVLQTRGKPAGMYSQWRSRARTLPREPAAPTSTPRVEQVSVDAYANATDQAEADVTVKVVDPDAAAGTLRIWSNPGVAASPDPTSEAPDASVSVSSGQTVGPTGSTANITTAALTNVLVASLPYGVKAIFADFETSDGRSSGPVLIPLMRTPDTGLPEIPGDIDDVPDGTNYGRPRIDVLTDGRVTRVRRTDGTDVTADEAVAANESITRLGDRTASNIAYADATAVENLKPAEAGAEANPPSIQSASLLVQDNGTDEIYSSDWTISDAVTTSYKVRIRYYKEGVRVGTNTVTATNLSDTFTNSGAGGSATGNEDAHHADFQLLDGGGSAVGGLLEHPEIVEAI